MGGVFAPFVEQFHVGVGDISRLQCLFHHVLVVGERHQFHVGLLECLLGHGEAVGVAGHHANHLAAVVANGLDGFQRRAARRDEVFDDDDLHAGLQFSLDEVLQSVVFWLGTHIDEGQVEGIGHEGALWDGSRCHAGNGFHLGEFLQDVVHNLELHIVAQVGIGEGLAVVAIER